MPSVCQVVQNEYEPDVRVRRKAEALVAAGYTVDVIALRSRSGRERTYTLNGVTVHTLPLAKKRGSLLRYMFEYGAFLFMAFVKLSCLMHSRRYAVVDINNLPDFLVFSALWAKWRGARVLFDMHEITPEFYMSKYGIRQDSMAIRLNLWLESLSMRFADRVVTINKPIEDLLVSRGLPRAKSTIIMNSVDEDQFVPRGDPPPPPPGFEPDPDAFVMMYHGTFTRIYGLDIALRAFARVHESMPKAQFWIVGGGAEQGPLEELSRELGVSSKVKFAGRVPLEQIPHWLRRCDVGVLATRQDVFLDLSFPNKLPEYIVMNRPVICSGLQTLRRYFSGDAVAFFTPNDPEDLARRMMELHGDKLLRQRLAAQAAREYEPIRWKVMKRRYLDLVEEMIHGAAPASSVADPQPGRKDALAS